jgi:hypothetical protein
VTVCHEQGDEALLTFAFDEVLARVEEQGDLFAPALSAKQQLPHIG